MPFVCIALMLQGSGALGSYQGWAYQYATKVGLLLSGIFTPILFFGINWRS